MFCADNYIIDPHLFSTVVSSFKKEKSLDAVYPRFYYYSPIDHSLNRYFSLVGGNDPVCWYLGKNDREPHVSSLIRKTDYPPSYGCNGFFYRAKAIKSTNLDHYYPMDNAMEIKGGFQGIDSNAIWHRTSDDLLTFMRKRYRYARDLYCDRKDRRWRVIGRKKDYWRLVGFILSTIFVIPCLHTSIKGYSKIKDPAWFHHYPVCLAFLITYGALTIRWLYVLSLSRLSDARRRSEIAWSLCGNKLIKILKSSK